MTMTTSRHAHSHRRLDVASLLLLLVGLISGVGCYWLITERAWNALILLPSVIAAFTGATHLTQWEAPRG